MPTFHWDFFGPPARAKAMHFLGHLNETLGNWKLPNTSTGLGSDGEGHHCVFLRVDPEYAEQLKSTLKPNRITDPEPGVDPS